MNAITYPEPDSEPLAPSPVASLPQPTRPRFGLSAAFGVVALLLTAIAAYLWWPNPAPPSAEFLVTGSAEQIVTAHLHGDRSALERLVAVEVPDTLAAGQSYVRSAVAVSVLDTAAGWEVVVAAEHLSAVPGGYANPRTEHFLVVFNERPTGPIAIALPAIVAAPDAPVVRAAAWPSPPPDEITTVTESYLRWLLTGEAGTFAGTPVTPPPFTDIVLVGMQRTDGEGGTDVLVAIDATRSDGSTLPLHYSLELEATDAGWLVSRPGS